MDASPNLRESYLRIVFELEEEGILPLRARLAERLGRTAPTVSKNVGHLMAAGCARIGAAGEVELTREGRLIALRVIRRHRLVECLLIGALGFEADLVDVEASKLAHVITERVERRLYEMLGRPQMTPSGARIPGLAELR